MIRPLLRSFLAPFKIAYTNYKLKKKYKTLKLSGKNSINDCKFGEYNYLENANLSNSELGSFSYIGKDSYVKNTKIGKFTCIGPNVKIGLGEHPTNTFVSVHPVFYSKAKQVGLSFVDKNCFEEYKETSIGHDVWVGANVIIRGGVKIGHGAIIASGAIVTKDILPYEIVGGIPAKVIKSRFEKDEIDALLKSAWWNNDIEWLNKKAQVFRNIKNFINDKEKL
ncbi:CatB-related O-acetyltransferase [uncultured Polaribacter sp.]|uniref:CatB-related O-acetyltransferase n=1 Tax=uncultured Polaribacter sp. TaxID=174711 RepID=UPI00262963C2|nr:CatB-related O-acetyltransferase [uncultured Polaribacter sp.]